MIDTSNNAAHTQAPVPEAVGEPVQGGSMAWEELAPSNNNNNNTKEELEEKRDGLEEAGGVSQPIFFSTFATEQHEDCREIEARQRFVQKWVARWERSKGVMVDFIERADKKATETGAKAKAEQLNQSASEKVAKWTKAARAQERTKKLIGRVEEALFKAQERMDESGFTRRASQVGTVFQTACYDLNQIAIDVLKPLPQRLAIEMPSDLCVPREEEGQGEGQREENEGELQGLVTVMGPDGRRHRVDLPEDVRPGEVLVILTK